MWCGGYDAAEFFRLPLDTRIRLAAFDMLGWRYGTGRKTRFPYARPMIPSQLVQKGTATALIDCSSFTAYILATVYPERHWSSARYAELQIFDAEEPWSPILAIERAGVGSRIPGPVPGVWALSQAWVDASTRDGDSVSGGHARIVLCRDTDRLLVLESSSRQNGVGPRWSEASYAELAKRYPAGVRLAALGPSPLEL